MIRLWRWLCCLTGHHRETVDPWTYGGGFAHGLDWKCVDCGERRVLIYMSLPVRTPSSRYALKRQERAA